MSRTSRPARPPPCRAFAARSPDAASPLRGNPCSTRAGGSPGSPRGHPSRATATTPLRAMRATASRPLSDRLGSRPLQRGAGGKSRSRRSRRRTSCGIPCSRPSPRTLASAPRRRDRRRRGTARTPRTRSPRDGRARLSTRPSATAPGRDTTSSLSSTRRRAHYPSRQPPPIGRSGYRPPSCRAFRPARGSLHKGRHRAASCDALRSRRPSRDTTRSRGTRARPRPPRARAPAERA